MHFLLRNTTNLRLVIRVLLIRAAYNLPLCLLVFGPCLRGAGLHSRPALDTSAIKYTPTYILFLCLLPFPSYTAPQALTQHSPIFRSPVSSTKYMPSCLIAVHDTCKTPLPSRDPPPPPETTPCLFLPSGRPVPRPTYTPNTDSLFSSEALFNHLPVPLFSPLL